MLESLRKKGQGCFMITLSGRIIHSSLDQMDQTLKKTEIVYCRLVMYISYCYQFHFHVYERPH
jgi:hypothetical protein